MRIALAYAFMAAIGAAAIVGLDSIGGTPAPEPQTVSTHSKGDRERVRGPSCANIVQTAAIPLRPGR